MNKILIIQSYYRGNKLRNKMKYFILLPDDIRKIIINYIKKYYYYNKYKIILNKIIYKKTINIYYLEGYFYTLLDYIYYNNYRDLSYIFSNIIGINIYIDKLINIYYLLNKYNKILNLNLNIYKQYLFNNIVYKYLNLNLIFINNIINYQNHNIYLIILNYKI